jgi:hypothetical protein
MIMISLPVSIDTKQIKAQRLDLSYPIVRQLHDKNIEQQINYEILLTVQKMLQKQGWYENPLTEITASYEIKTNERGILSLTLINYAYSGGAHGITIIEGLTFDVTTGKRYKLSELFQKNSNYVEKISEIVKNQIKERDIFLLEPPFKGISPEQDYYIADKALVLFFQLYELTAYAYGFPYFPISIYDLQTIIDEQGPLGKMVG